MHFEIDCEKRPELVAIVLRLHEERCGSLFSFALYARTMWALAHTACDNESDEFQYCVREAYDAAYDAGEYYSEAPTPALFDDVDELCHHFSMGASDELARREAELRETHNVEQRKVELARINALIEANAWSDLNLPTPEELTVMLLAGESTTIEGHFVDYDSGDDVTWYTNPYGVDGALFSRPTVDAVRSFLVDMARGIEYGPIP